MPFLGIPSERDAPDPPIWAYAKQTGPRVDPCWWMQIQPLKKDPDRAKKFDRDSGRRSSMATAAPAAGTAVWHGLLGPGRIASRR